VEVQHRLARLLSRLPRLLAPACLAGMHLIISPRLRQNLYCCTSFTL
jgi:hypothetical protein